MTEPNEPEKSVTSKKDNNRLAHSFLKKNQGKTLSLHQLQENFKEWSKKVIQGHKNQDTE